MALPVSAKLQHGKKAKFEKELERLLQDFPAKKLNSYLQEMFETKNPPNVRRFIKMISSAKFGGENHWTSVEAGPRLIFEFVNAVWPQFKLNFQKNFEDLDEFKDPISFNHISKTPIGYLLNYVAFFPKIGKHIENISISDFKRANEISPFLYLEKETNSYGFCFIPLASHTPEQVEEFVKDTLFLNKRVPWLTESKPFPEYSPIQKYSTGPLTHIFPFLLYVGTVEELIDCIPDREIIDVAAHLRYYVSGKISQVKAYKKRKPIRASEVRDDITSHIVYRVYDSDDKLRYIGEGKENRDKHVNSGASHNVKINEHFFTKGPMRIERIDNGLTKGEARAFERAILNQLRGHDLWNKKDFEPFRDENDKGYTDEEVKEYFSSNNE